MNGIPRKRARERVVEEIVLSMQDMDTFSKDVMHCPYTHKFSKDVMAGPYTTIDEALCTLHIVASSQDSACVNLEMMIDLIG